MGVICLFLARDTWHSALHRGHEPKQNPATHLSFHSLLCNRYGDVVAVTVVEALVSAVFMLLAIMIFGYGAIQVCGPRSRMSRRQRWDPRPPNSPPQADRQHRGRDRLGVQSIGLPRAAAAQQAPGRGGLGQGRF